MLASLGCFGCVSRAKARADAEGAFRAGQQETFQRLQRVNADNQLITIFGPVRHSLVPWSPGLTLAKAIVAAEYFGRTDPSQIIIVRQGKGIVVEPGELLEGRDVPLQPGDILQFQEGPPPPYSPAPNRK